MTGGEIFGEDRNFCGTTCCLAGEIYIHVLSKTPKINPPKYYSHEIFETARDFLGIQSSSADWLFRGRWRRSITGLGEISQSELLKAMDIFELVKGDIAILEKLPYDTRWKLQGKEHCMPPMEFLDEMEKMAKAIMAAK